MIIGIDASNLITGGGVSHVVGILDSLDVVNHGISSIIVWSNDKTLSKLPDREWLHKRSNSWLNGGLIKRIFWRVFKLDKLVERECDVLFIPSGVYRGSFHPNIVMPRNMLIYDERERRRFGFSWMYIKHLILEFVQSRSIKNSDGVIFISNFSKEFISRKHKLKNIFSRTIYHGVASKVRREPVKQLAIDSYSIENPYKILYVSTVFPYKHQWNLVEAVSEIRREGFPVELHLVGGGYLPSIERLEKSIGNYDPKQEFIKYHGGVDADTVTQFYHNSNLFVYASTCETMPNILIEAMNSGLPIVCSKYEPMPEILGSAGIYFDPLDIEDTKNAISDMIKSSSKRAKLSGESYCKAAEFSWNRCSEDTFSFISSLYAKSRSLY
jgi:glycosyltransferase involved in cell wall biosynthesis